jgi:restriction system protein
MAGSLYHIDVSHPGLHTFRRIVGRDQYVIRQKADAQIAAWDAKWKKLQERASHLRSKEEKRDEAARRTTEAQEALRAIDDTLLKCLQVSSVLDWESLKDRTQFSKPQPNPPVQKEAPPQPRLSDVKYQPIYSFLDRILSSRRRTKESIANHAFQTDLSAWQKIAADLKKECETTLKRHQESIQRWQNERAAFYEREQQQHAMIDGKKEAYFAGSSDAIEEYCDVILAASDYPEEFPKSCRCDYNHETRMLLVDYSLPDIVALPRLKEVKYVATRDEFSEVYIQDNAIEKLYDGLLYKVAIRSIYELFQSDVIGAIDWIVLNGWVTSIDKATGLLTTGCILSIQVSKNEFQGINLAQIDPKACFRKLKGVGSSKLAALVPVRPILEMDTRDDRFVPSHNVADELDDSVNLAAMDWEEFEHLIRELFEKEFKREGAEVKITRTSRDGGVDAVVFDPDPLRGGKIVIQAKRYTNTVGVAAVRDLYGTVVNEGATKGILVTTADYGPDAYEFAKDKPLALLSGSNLLHLLGKHGYRAKIDLKEAKVILKSMAYKPSAPFTP